MNEALVMLLMAKKFDVPRVPHAGGVGLCQYVQHPSTFDHVAVGASLADRGMEYVDHLNEHFLDLVVVENGRCVAPRKPGYSIEMRPESLDGFEFPNGLV